MRTRLESKGLENRIHFFCLGKLSIDVFLLNDILYGSLSLTYHVVLPRPAIFIPNVLQLRILLVITCGSDKTP